ncbi:hypothetical protein TcasGA2_TC001375 [Tribolium castaneum]|uniref:CHK kinase-like domain-containing protein n=1 Tax=Tribolium castaneum TaxID=7070 RepID=D6WCP5_TRICA|nr:PREDICTED: uncharacterized protein LOC657005 [Tribolium castaneum]EEZ98805.1 hypothetical protein TcasGA2_TC001375 [Tribolium castaneum]|eukprot:XP_968587.1 PREDICTED: uncharacterized protein LOC657005 [Tribolium castaneum]
MVKSKVNDLRALLAKTLGSDIEITDQKTTLLTAPGEHYGSIMLALDVTLKKSGKEQKYNLVAKLIPANEMLRVAFDIYVTFKKEVLAYTETIPYITQLQRQYQVPEHHLFDKLFAKCYGARLCLDTNKNEVDEDAVLIFENLKLQGYKTEDRLVGFDLKASKIILRDLARFHAAPIAVKRLKFDDFQAKVLPALAKNKGLEQLPPEVTLAFHNSIMEGALEVPELEEFLPRMQKVVDYAASHPYVNRPPPKELWGSMSHSDFWTSNTMILRNELGEPVSNKIVDLQIMTYSSIARDVIFFMFTSIINRVLEENYEELLRTYYDSFVNTLKEFELDVSEYSWENFLKELDEVAPSEIYHVLVMLKPICTERGKVENSLEDFQDSDWSRKDLLGPSHRKKLKDTVLAFVKRNWI